ncbi:hypothetical protein BGZ73_004580 [Actinomortierella ambigua]|nr:hypothetical protein BGZ73_004580 [Actinomortierella ambigua]
MPDPALPPQPQVQQDPIPDTSAQVSHSSAKYVEPSKRARKKVQIFMSLLNKGKGDGTIETETVEPDPLLDDDIEETAPHRVRERLFLRPKDYKSGDPIPGFPLSLEHSKAVDENDTTRFSTWTPSSESFLRVSASQITPLLNTTFSPVVARPYALYLRVKSAQEARQEARFKACISVYYDVTAQGS